jgi:hypothetical protein
MMDGPLLRRPPDPIHPPHVPPMNGPALRARSVGEILDLSFQIYRSRWPAMAAATGLFVFPLLLLEAVAPLNSLSMLESLGNLFFLAASAAVVVIASEAYLGREVAAADAVRIVGRRFFSVWGAAIIQGILVFLGLLLFIVPGIIALALTFGMQQAVMIEGKSAGEAFERSRSLAGDHFKHILLTSVLAFIIVIFAMLGFGMLIGYGVTDVRMSTLLVNLALVAINPLAAVVGTVLYYDLRIRKEAFDVAVAMERLGPNEPVPAL